LARGDARMALELLRPALGAAGLLADLGCGYGRHLNALAGAGHRRLIGVDRSELLLIEARRLVPRARFVRADLRAMPLATSSLDAAACFYSSMFLGTDEDAVAALREARRALKPEGLLLLTTDNPLRLMASPQGGFSEDVAGLGRVVEQSAFDAQTRVDTVERRLETGAGELRGTFRIRYFLPDELASVARRAGLRLLRLEPDAPLQEATPQLAALLGR
jgi:SAM-dependent methyltransferase